MSANRAFFAIATMARVLGVSTAGYYAWRSRLPSARAIADDALLRRVRTIHAVSRGTYGAPRVHAELRAEGQAVGRKRIARLMRAAGIVGVSRRRAVITTRRDRDARPAPDLVDRNFTAERPNQLWVADITYIPTATGFLYLAVVLDAFSRRLGDGDASADRARAGGIGDGDRSAQAEQCHPPQRQGHRWRSAAAAGKLVCAHPWDLSVTPTTTPCARASSPRWNVSCWHAAGSHRRPRPGWRSSATSRGGTIPPVAILASAIYPQSPTRRRYSRKPKRPK